MTGFPLKAPVALIGVGRMGAAFVQRWRSANRPVRVWNRNYAAALELSGQGVSAIQALKDAVENTSLVVSCVTDGAALRDVMIGRGALASMDAGSVLVDLSTVDVDSSRTVAQEAQRLGISYLRGFVSGSPDVVSRGNSLVALSGKLETLQTALPVLKEISDDPLFVGEGESARIIKLAINVVVGGTVQLLAEATSLAESSGVTRDDLFSALDRSVVSSSLLRYKGKALSQRDETVTASVSSLTKDLSLAVSAAKKTALPVTQTVLAQLAIAQQQGMADEDCMKLLELLSGNRS